MTETAASATSTRTWDVVVAGGSGPLALRVHRDDAAGWDTPQPVVVVLGSWLTVKEQMADRYAAELARRGYTAVTFDPSGFGASAGAVRQYENPLGKARDLADVVDAVSSWSTSGPVGVLGICAGAQYALAALARGLPVGAYVGVAGWFHDLASVTPFYGGPDGVATRLDRASAAAPRLAAGDAGDADLAPAYAPGDDRAGMSMELDYYADPARGAVPTWRNAMSELSWWPWLTFDAFRAAAAAGDRVPALLVHSPDAVLPDGARRVAELLSAEMRWTPGGQTDFYDRDAQLGVAVDAALAHFDAHLGGIR